MGTALHAMMDRKRDIELFCQRMPKMELHAHLTGSIRPATLHEVWKEMKQADPNFDLGDPIEYLGKASETMDATSFFPLFSKFIYRLCNSKRTIEYCTRAVLADFAADGVVYLELRTIPRAASDLSKEEYVATVLEAIRSAPSAPARTYLILGVDRKNTPAEALDTVELAIKYAGQDSDPGSDSGGGGGPRVVGVDLCGNPAKGDVTHFGEAFARARAAGLHVTLHFAELPASSTEAELRALLAYGPERLGHVIRVPDWARQEIIQRRLGLELCLTCNVKAKLLVGSDGKGDGEAGDGGDDLGVADHHFAFWRDKGCPIAICTDDVGIFGSSTAAEFALLMRHFRLTRRQALDVGRSAVDCIFGPDPDKAWLRDQMARFEAGDGTAVKVDGQQLSLVWDQDPAEYAA